MLSGSFVVAGSGRMLATKVGADSYAFKLSSEARRFSLVKSELRDGINTIIRFVGYLMIPTAILLITAQIRADEGFVSAVQGSVAGLVAMVPEGLVLLTSIAFAVGATRLAKKQVLTQELAAIEGLARVDVVCVDKTGTLTEGELVLATVEHLDETTSLTAVPPWPRWRPSTSTRTRACWPSSASTTTPRAGPPPRSCRSPRPASGARPPSPTTAPGCSARPTSC